MVRSYMYMAMSHMYTVVSYRVSEGGRVGEREGGNEEGGGGGGGGMRGWQKGECVPLPVVWLSSDVRRVK